MNRRLLLISGAALALAAGCGSSGGEATATATPTATTSQTTSTTTSTVVPTPVVTATATPVPATPRPVTTAAQARTPSPVAKVLPPTAQPVPAAQDHVVKVADSDPDPQKWTWVPEVVDVKIGDTVTWNMIGAQVPHTATADDGSWDSGYLTPGSKWTHKFGALAEIHYHCTPHPWKKGIIRVHA
ncbi:MAG: hypothetical protein JOZ41_00155 [Chloroflexi bacterium]|nr:hypothetical protein [Chloroflexota bacterium]